MNYKIWGRKFEFRGRRRLHRLQYIPGGRIRIPKAAGDCRMPIGKHELLNVLWSKICIRWNDVPATYVWKTRFTLCLVTWNLICECFIWFETICYLTVHMYSVKYKLSSKFCDRQTDVMDRYIRNTNRVVLNLTTVWDWTDVKKCWHMKWFENIQNSNESTKLVFYRHSDERSPIIFLSNVCNK